MISGSLKVSFSALAPPQLRRLPLRMLFRDRANMQWVKRVDAVVSTDHDDYPTP